MIYREKRRDQNLNESQIILSFLKRDAIPTRYICNATRYNEYMYQRFITTEQRLPNFIGFCNHYQGQDEMNRKARD